MAKFVLTDCYFALNSVDLSDHVSSITIDISNDIQESSAMSDTWRAFLAGPNGATLRVEFRSNFASSSVEDTIWGQSPFAGTASTTFEIRPTSSAAAVGNPKYTGSCIVESFPLISGAWGSTANNSVNLKVTGAVTRATA